MIPMMLKISTFNSQKHIFPSDDPAWTNCFQAAATSGLLLPRQLFWLFKLAMFLMICMSLHKEVRMSWSPASMRYPINPDIEQLWNGDGVIWNDAQPYDNNQKLATGSYETCPQ